jgi:hypothetical protein
LPGVPDCAPTLVEPLPPLARPVSPFGPLEPPMEAGRFVVAFVVAFGGGVLAVELLEGVGVTVAATWGAGAGMRNPTGPDSPLTGGLVVLA